MSMTLQKSESQITWKIYDQAHHETIINYAKVIKSQTASSTHHHQQAASSTAHADRWHQWMTTSLHTQLKMRKRNLFTFNLNITTCEEMGEKFEDS